MVLYISLYMVESERQFNSISSLNHEIAFIQRVNRIAVVWNVRICNSGDRGQRLGVTWFILLQMFCIEAGRGKFRRYSICVLKDRSSRPRQHNFLLTTVDLSKPKSKKVKLSHYRSWQATRYAEV